MRSLSRLVIVAAVFALVSVGVAHGGEARPASPAAGDPHHGVAGGDLSDWLARYWTTIMKLPADSNPYAGTGDPCIPLDGRTIAPYALPPEQPRLTCVVRPGTRVLMLGAIAECSDLEGDPFHATTYPGAIACAKEWIGDLTRHEVLVDRSQRIDLLAGHSAATPYLSVRLPEGNIFGVAENTRIKFASFGYGVLLRPLSPGRHDITIKQVGQANPTPVSPTFVVTVIVRPGGHD